VLRCEGLPIASDDTAGTLERKLAELGARLIVTALADLGQGAARVTPQPSDGITYARKIGKEEARIDWRRTWAEVDRQIRAFNPSPGAVTRVRGEDIKIWSAAPLPGESAPAGTIIRIHGDGIDVGCGAGALRLRELQRAGGKRLPAGAFLRGHPLAPGDAFEPVAPIEPIESAARPPI